MRRVCAHVFDVHISDDQHLILGSPPLNRHPRRKSNFLSLFATVLSMSYRGGRGGSGGGGAGGGGGMGGGYKVRGRSSPYARNGGNRKTWNQPNRNTNSGGKEENTGSGVGRSEVGIESVHSVQQHDMPAVSVSESAHHEISRVDTRVTGDTKLKPSMADSARAAAANNTTPSRTEKKSSIKSRLFVGNLPRDTKDAQVKDMFAVYGEVSEVFVQKEKAFGFVRMVSYVLSVVLMCVDWAMWCG